MTSISIVVDLFDIPKKFLIRIFIYRHNTYFKIVVNILPPFLMRFPKFSHSNCKINNLKYLRLLFQDKKILFYGSH
jgi:hypothetical protein